MYLKFHFLIPLFLFFCFTAAADAENNLPGKVQSIGSHLPEILAQDFPQAIPLLQKNGCRLHQTARSRTIRENHFNGITASKDCCSSNHLADIGFPVRYCITGIYLPSSCLLQLIFPCRPPRAGPVV